MKANVDPVLGNWYRHLDQGYEFQVVAHDETDGVVEIQHFDGDVEALELDEWKAMALEHIEPPEEWAGAIEDFENDDTGYADVGLSEEWSEGLSEWQEDRMSRGDD